MSISPEIKDKILQSIDIVDVVGEVVSLRKKGSNYSGLCPFHNEKTPSFMVSPDKGIYKCFGCSKSGNVISFMVDYHGLSYPDALKELGRRAGIQVEEVTSQKTKQQLSKKELVMLALDSAAHFFAAELNKQAGKIAKNYYLKRGFSAETIENYKLGYAPESWDSLLIELRRQKFKDDTILDAGLILKNENKDSFYDRFRGRAIFPILDFMGKVIGFGARQLTEDKNQPKYINSPQTIAYDKSHTLYGIWHAKNEIRSKAYAVMVEGYADVITCHQAGFKNVVASSGTSLTVDQLNTLFKLCKTIYFIYDADEAGINATERGIEMALEKGFEVKIVTLPSGEDPDSMINNHGASVFGRYLNEASSFLDYLVFKYEASGKFSSPAGKADSVRKLAELIIKIPDKLQHDDYIANLASLLKLTETQLNYVYKEIGKLQQPNAKSNRQVTKEYSSSASKEQPNQPEKTSSETDFKLLNEEKILIGYSLKSDLLFEMIFKKFGITVDFLFTDAGKRIFSKLSEFSVYEDNFISRIFSGDLSEEDQTFIAGLAFKDDELSPNWTKFANQDLEIDYAKVIKDLIYKLELIKIENILKKLKNDLKSTDGVEQMALIKEISELNNRKSIISQEISKN